MGKKNKFGDVYFMDFEPEKALKKLRKREKVSKLRKITNISQLRIGDMVSDRKTRFPMEVVGIFQEVSNPKDGTLYLDFDGNEGDVWEEYVKDVEFRGNVFSVIFKKIIRNLC